MDPLAGEGAALWCLMIRHAVLTGEFPTADDVLPHLPNAANWADVLATAETSAPETFVTNGWVVGAMQAAWSSITHTPVTDDAAGRPLQVALATAIGIGNDTDTVAAIAGGLLGARWGASAIPQEWTGLLHGWGVKGAGAPELIRLATEICREIDSGVTPGTAQRTARETGA
ncbi:ADP-ribosylglycohydrolase family protein [Nocardioides jensenii]|uniref:ADP-ribosylglycohydrolase family protein n=1 Tax=Nocardioides jensenii TaxID=1843 RepID=UPI000B33A201|nr:ADP-ribosylglycohydrolase family protein [Nocardioides jensenii]